MILNGKIFTFNPCGGQCKDNGHLRWNKKKNKLIVQSFSESISNWHLVFILKEYNLYRKFNKQLQLDNSAFNKYRVYCEMTEKTEYRIFYLHQRHMLEYTIDCFKSILFFLIFRCTKLRLRTKEKDVEIYWIVSADRCEIHFVQSALYSISISSIIVYSRMKINLKIEEMKSRVWCQNINGKSYEIYELKNKTEAKVPDINYHHSYWWLRFFSFFVKSWSTGKIEKKQKTNYVLTKRIKMKLIYSFRN